MIDEKTVITCRHCGASIEIDDKHPCPILAAHDFKAMHNSCRAGANSKPVCYVRTPLIEFTPEALEWMSAHPGAIPVVTVTADDLRRQAANDFASEILSKPLTRGMAPTPAPDPYARFRDAIRDKNLFQRRSDGCMYRVLDPDFWCHALSYPPESLFVAGIDIPMQPTQEWLDRNGVELNGECRAPDLWELWASADLSGVMGESCADLAFISDFDCRRWILRKRAKLCANCGGIIADGNTVYKKGMVLCACRPCPTCKTLTANLGLRQTCAKCKGGPLTPRDPTDSEIATHAAEHDAIVRNLLMDCIRKTMPIGIVYGQGAPVPERVGDHCDLHGANVVIAITESRPVNLHIGQSASYIVKQARDLVQGMGITKKTKYCAFNIVGSELIWGIK